MQEPDLLRDSSGLPVIRSAGGKKPSLWGYLRSRFVTGLLVAFPLVVTIFFGRFLFNLLDRWFYPLAQRFFGHPVPGLGAAIATVLIFFLGILAHNVLGRRILKTAESVVTSIPVLRPVYLGAREVSRAFSQDRAQGFRRVVLIPFPHPGAWSVAFLTGEFHLPQGDLMVTVFMPTTPNPTTGFFLAFPKSAVRLTELSVEEAIRTVISGGLGNPDHARLFAALQGENS